jgi:hypothetical protein
MKLVTRTLVLLPALGAPAWAQFGTPSAVSGLYAGEAFGHSVCDVGDINGDSVGDFAVGAPFGGSSTEGMLYVFDGASLAMLFRVPGTAAGDQFGWDIDGLGDIDGDGVPDIVVGAPQLGISPPLSSGYLRAISGANGATIWTAVPVWAGSTVGAGFGRSVANAGDLDGDGLNDAVGGAPFIAFPFFPFTIQIGTAQAVNSASGAIFPNGVSGSTASNYAGWSVDGAGDINGDSVPDLLVGMPGANSAQVISGASIVNGPTAVLYTITGPANSFMGSAVSGVGDLTGNGRAEFLIGGYGNFARLYSDAGVQLWSRSAPGAGAQPYGSALDGGGDLDGDGSPDMLIAARSRPSAPNAAGVDYISGAFLPANGPTGTLWHPAGIAAGFGNSIAFFNTGSVVVGEPSNGPGGSASVYP